MSRIRKAALVSLFILPLAAGGFVLQHRSDREGARLFDRVFGLVSARFVDTLGTDELYARAARGLLSELDDPYAALVSPKEMEEFTVETAGRYGGIGLLIEDHEGKFTVNRVFPNTPGEQAGVQPGDLVMAIDGKPTHGWEFANVTGALKGEPGTRVMVDFARPGVAQPIQIKLTRAVVRIPSVPYAMMLDHKTGYIPLQQFSENSTLEVQSAVRRLQSEGMQSLVLDFRGNGGGYTDQALAIANFFLPRGAEIYSVRTRDSMPERYYASRDPIAPDLPLVVLTDGYSASATEIVAGALQDHDRALVLGTTSFGKGLVQTVYPLEDGWVVKMTTGKWFTPSGRSIQRPDRDVGVSRQAADTAEPAVDSLAVRPSFRSDAGRVVYGGGAITPDIIVKYDTMTTVETTLAKAIAPKSQDAYLALYELALDMRSKVRPDFQVSQEERDDFFRRLQARGVTLDRAQYDAGHRYIDRLIGNKVATMAFGDSTAKRRAIPDDAQLRRALELIQQGRTQKDLLALASSNRG
jgi:carboxyl-terminal processing protease